MIELRIRPIDLSSTDIDKLLTIYMNPLNLSFIPNSGGDWTRNRLIEKYRKANSGYSQGYGIFIVEDKVSGQTIGEAGLFNSFANLKHLELGYIVDQPFWGQGLGTCICKALINYGFCGLQVERLSARMFEINRASIRIAEKCGMQLVEQGISKENEPFCVYRIENKR